MALRCSDDVITMTVADDGDGIEQDALDKVFEPYWRGNSTAKGIGLGLAIVKALVEGHDGEITVTSAGRRRGFVLYRSFPP